MQSLLHPLPYIIDPLLNRNIGFNPRQFDPLLLFAHLCTPQSPIFTCINCIYITPSCNLVARRLSELSLG